ncbi:CynX/NimT family MFS transporter [Eikenella corrodens]
MWRVTSRATVTPWNTPSASGLLTTIPVLCFGLFTPLASKLIIRTGLEKAIILTLLGVMAGSLIRVVGNVPMMLIGTVIIGLSLTVGNLLGILIIGRDFKQSAGIMTGIMVLGMSLGGMITSSLTPPLAQYTNWQLALASWFLLALICLLFWIKTMTSRTHRAREVLDNLSITPKNQAEETEHHSNSKRDKAILFLIIAFACHCFAFYGIVAWLPRFLIDSGMSANRAGLAVSVFHMLGFIGALPTMLPLWMIRYIGNEKLIKRLPEIFR